MASAPVDVAPFSPTDCATLSELRTELARVRAVWTQQPPTADEYASFLSSFRKSVAACFEESLAQKHRVGPTAVAEAVELLFELGAAGANDHCSPDESVTEASLGGNSTTKLLRTIALVPAWQSGAARLSDVPNWLLPVCAAYHFFGPTLLTTDGQAEAFTHDYVQAARDLARYAELNRGSGAVRAAIDTYKRSTPPSPAWAGSLWTDVVSCRARLASALSSRVPLPQPLAIPREGRKLRLGVVAEQLPIEGAAASALTLLERLDSKRFDVALLSRHPDSPFAMQLRNRGADLVPLGSTAAEALQSLQDATLDAALFIFNPADPGDLVPELARHRVAPLQLWHDGQQEAPGQLAIDVFLCGTATGQGLRTSQPRAALLPGIGSLEKNEMVSQSAGDPTRAEVGVADDEIVFISFAPLASITPEMRTCWARILKHVPRSRLLLFPGSGSAPEPEWTRRFCAEFDATLSAEGAASNQLIVFPEAFGSYEARKRILSLADVLLDGISQCDPEAALAASERGVPVVALAGPSPRTRRTAGLLELAGVPELVAATPDEYAAVATRLGTDAAWREEVKKRWSSASPTLNAHHDSFAQSEGFGWALEHAFDEIVANPAAFAANAEPLHPPSTEESEFALNDAQVLLDMGLPAEAAAKARISLAANPANPDTRRMIGRAIRLDGNLRAAADWLISQLELKPATAEMWAEIAEVSAEAGRNSNALEAAKAALALDPRRVETWLFLGRFKDQTIRSEAEAMLRQIAPDDPRVIKLFGVTAN